MLHTFRNYEFISITTVNIKETDHKNKSIRSEGNSEIKIYVSILATQWEESQK
jgi:hypothetical protein